MFASAFLDETIKLAADFPRSHLTNALAVLTGVSAGAQVGRGIHEIVRTARRQPVDELAYKMNLLTLPLAVATRVSMHADKKRHEAAERAKDQPETQKVAGLPRGLRSWTDSGDPSAWRTRNFAASRLGAHEAGRALAKDIGALRRQQATAPTPEAAASIHSKITGLKGGDLGPVQGHGERASARAVMGPPRLDPLVVKKLQRARRTPQTSSSNSWGHPEVDAKAREIAGKLRSQSFPAAPTADQIQERLKRNPELQRLSKEMASQMAEHYKNRDASDRRFRNLKIGVGAGALAAVAGYSLYEHLKNRKKKKKSE